MMKVMEKISHTGPHYFEMVAEFARALSIVPKQLWDTRGHWHNDSDSNNAVIMTHTILCEGSATLRIYRITDNTIGMGKMSVKPPMPAQFNGRNPQFREWSGEVHVEDCMDKSAKSVEAIDIRNNQEAYVEEDIQYRDNKYPIQPTEDEADEFEDYNEITMSIRKKRDVIISILQTLNYVLVHATKPGSEPHSMIRRIMHTANGVEAWSN
eukprot:706951-Amphidinium_carterae.3